MIKNVFRIGGLFQTPLDHRQKENSRLNIKEAGEKKIILHSYPRRIVLELTNRCDLRCIMCGRNYLKFSPSTMSLDVLKKIDPFLRLAEEVTLFGWGEPTVNPNFTKFFEHLDRYQHLRKYLLTNGSSLETVKEVIRKYRLDILAVSLDGAKAKTNDSIRCGSSFTHIIDQLSQIVNLRKKGIRVPYINFVFVAMKKNIHELPDLIRLAKKLRIPEVKCVYLTAFGKTIEGETMWYHQKECKKYFAKAKRVAKSLLINLKLPSYIGECPAGNLSHQPCALAWRDLFIGSDGNIRLCQSSNYIIGNITLPNSAQKLWNNKKYQRARATVNTETKMPEGCAHCYQSSHANWNKKCAHIQAGIDLVK